MKPANTSQECLSRDFSSYRLRSHRMQRWEMWLVEERIQSQGQQVLKRDEMGSKVTFISYGRKSTQENKREMLVSRRHSVLQLIPC